MIQEYRSVENKPQICGSEYKYIKTPDPGDEEYALNHIGGSESELFAADTKLAKAWARAGLV